MPPDDINRRYGDDCNAQVSLTRGQGARQNSVKMFGSTTFCGALVCALSHVRLTWALQSSPQSILSMKGEGHSITVLEQ